MIVLIHSLKSKIFINLAILLLLAVVLTDYVIIVIIQKKLILEKINSGQNIIINLVTQLDDGFDINVPVVSDTSLMYGYILSGTDTELSFGEYKKDINKNIPFIIREAVKSGKPLTLFSGDTWGVFWKQKKYLILAVPFSTGQNELSGGVVVFQLDDIYKVLRKSHKYIAVYLFVNLLILLFISFYRFWGLIFRPIQKIINIAKEYSSSERLEFAPEKRYHEFNELSNSLNRMVQRIEDDNEKLKTSMKMLQEANFKLKNTQAEMIRTEKLASIGRLSAGIAHEIGNPIGIVVGYLGLLKNRQLARNDSDAQDYINRAEREIGRINDIIRQLLDFSRTTPIRFSPISIHSVILDVVDVMSEQPLMANIRIETRLSSPLDVVFADYNQVRQVLINLMINAADSIAVSDNKTNGLIKVITDIISDEDESSLKNKSSLKLMMIDNGSGISATDLDNIFDPFYTTKDPGKGTGLGLSVSYTIVEQIGGIIVADSEIGKGSTMTIFLPLFENV